MVEVVQEHPITLYWTIGSQPARAVKALLVAGGVPHNTVNIDLLKGEQYGADFKKVNPRGLVPVITDDTFKLAESNAILKYLASTQSTIPEHYWPKNEQERAVTDQYLEYYQNHFRPALIGPLRLRMGRAVKKIDYTPEALAKAETDLYAALDTFELMLEARDGAFIVNDNVTIADLQLFFEFENMVYYKLTWEKYPEISKWYKAMLAVPVVGGIHEKWEALV